MHNKAQLPIKIEGNYYEMPGKLRKIKVEYNEFNSQNEISNGKLP